VKLETGAAGAPAAGSGEVSGATAVTDDFDRQAHQVVVPLQPNVQTRAVANTKQLAALKAAPFSRLDDRRSEDW
jgi:hypothetical protein